MKNINLFYTIMIYLLQAILIYLLLRYTSFIRMQPAMAAVTTLIIVIIIFVIHFLYVNFFEKSTVEGFNSESCESCSIERKCKIVCDETNESNNLPEASSINTVENIPNNIEIKPASSVDTPNGSANQRIEALESIVRNLMLPNSNIQQNQTRVSNVIGNPTSWQIPGVLPTTNIDNDLPYSDFNHIPLINADYEYGYSYMPPQNWYPQGIRPPVCLTDQRSFIYPSYTNGIPIDAKEVITQPAA